MLHVYGQMGKLMDDLVGVEMLYETGYLTTLRWDTADDYECMDARCGRHHEKHIWSPNCRDFISDGQIEPMWVSDVPGM
jgi:hypothetical protein